MRVYYRLAYKWGSKLFDTQKEAFDNWDRLRGFYISELTLWKYI